MKVETKIECDSEGCEETVTVTGTYPYSEGWRYIHQLNFKDEKGEHQYGYKHFCSQEHFEEYIKEKIGGE